jgi:hypothetical protein
MVDPAAAAKQFEYGLALDPDSVDLRLELVRTRLYVVVSRLHRRADVVTLIMANVTWRLLGSTARAHSPALR